MSHTLGFVVIAVDVKGARDGATFDFAEDCTRLDNQAEQIYGLMNDGVWRSLNGIAIITGYPEASVSARLRDFRKPKFGGHTVNRKRITGGLWIYQLQVRQELCGIPLSEIKLFASIADTLDPLMNHVESVENDTYAASN